ncbi:MAG TPA: IPT/TIG domain-containing protein [Terracidiphilus sp.]|nr:IPT/TIG domain-containing protein [Terracidiphilus sp.]
MIAPSVHAAKPQRWRTAAALALCLLGLCLFGLAPSALAGGPKYVAGTSFFNPAVLGQPVVWAGGQVSYYVDQGPLSATVTNQQATAMVDAAAALWSAIPTAAVTLTDAGSLNEDVNGSNTAAGNPVFTAPAVFAAPADLAPSATSYPVAVVYDADGSVIDTLFGAGASDADACQNNGVFAWSDNFNPNATFAHAVILLNGLCTATANQLEAMSYQLERAFGEVLGLGFSQVNPGAFTSGDPNQTLGLPVMEPLSGACGPAGGACIPDPGSLRFDDIAALNRLYPIAAANLASFPGKQLTAANTVSIAGSLTFSQGVGMQGVNVVARPLDTNGNPLYAYTVTAVSGALFSGNRGNLIAGTTNANGIPLSQWGSNDPSLQGQFDLSFMPLPPGVSTATYQITFEPINPLYILEDTVGPYIDGSPAPSGTMPMLTAANLAAGSAQTFAVPIAGSAAGGDEDAIATPSTPRPVPPSGQWVGRIGQVGQTDWFAFPVRANRTFTVLTQALNESGLPSESKAMPEIGLWNGSDAVNAAPAIFAPGLNGYATGETFISAASATVDTVRVAIADERGDGRPDYEYVAWVLYADTVSPARLPAAGGPIVIHGMGFRPADTVKVGGLAATVTSISPNEITAIAPASATTGSVDVEVDELPIFSALAVLSGAISYDAGTGDALTLVTAPANTVPTGVPLPFTVTALGPNLQPAGGVTVTYAVTSGAATLGCGQPACAVTTTGDGTATLTVTATSSTLAVVTASLLNGASLQAHFTGGIAPTLTALTSSLSVAAGATVSWPVSALVLQNGVPMSGQTVTWASVAGIAAGGSATSNSGGIAASTLTISGLAEGQQAVSNACVNGTQNCAAFTVLGARPEYAAVEPVSGTAQSLAVSATPAQIVLRVRDMNGNPLAGGVVTFYQALYAWAPPCSTHGRCAAAQLLATQVATATSALDGTVIFTPASLPGIPTNLAGLAVTGDASTVAISIEQHP